MVVIIPICICAPIPSQSVKVCFSDFVADCTSDCVADCTSDCVEMMGTSITLIVVLTDRISLKVLERPVPSVGPSKRALPNREIQSEIQ